MLRYPRFRPAMNGKEYNLSFQFPYHQSVRFPFLRNETKLRMVVEWIDELLLVVCGIMAQRKNQQLYKLQRKSEPTAASFLFLFFVQVINLVIFFIMYYVLLLCFILFYNFCKGNRPVTANNIITQHKA